MDESDRFYRELCSSETLRSGTKGFFKDFSDSVTDEAGDNWIEKIFGRLDNDEERVRIVLTDPKVKSTVLDTLRRVKHLYRDKDAATSRNKRLEGLEVATSGDHEKALLLFSQAVLRAPATGKFPAVDQGFTFPLGLLARADSLMALRDYDFALKDLRLAAEEDLPQTARQQLVVQIEQCNRFIAEADRSLIPYETSAATSQLKRQFRRRVMTREWVSGQDRTRDALVAHVNQVWADMETKPNITQNLVNSLPNRMQSVIDNEGYWINY